MHGMQVKIHIVVCIEVLYTNHKKHGGLKMLSLNLKKIMNRKALNIKQVSDLTGISRNTISQFYNGKSKGIQFETLSKLVNGLDVHLEDLIDSQSSLPNLDFYIEQITDPDDLDILGDPEWAFEVGLVDPEENTDAKNHGTVVKFRIPTKIKVSAKSNKRLFNTLWINWDYSSLEDLIDPEISKRELLVDTIVSSSDNDFEMAIGSICRELIEELLKIDKFNKLFKDIHFVKFETNITDDLEWNPEDETYLQKSKVLMWNKETITNTNMFDYYIDTKYL
ncbi:helix-turn-helix transcriptional regulator [Pediococcus pentosaceus]